jgi:RNA polymerase-binding protein DksA
MITAKETAAYRDRLQKLLTRIGRSQTALREESMLGTGGEGGGGLSDVPLHPADLGNRATEEETSLLLLENEERLIQEINLALSRLNAGTYGRCETCRKNIAKERLDAVPYARRCIHCAREEEQRPNG